MAFMNQLEALITQCPEIERRLGYAFKDKQLLLLAFVHRSFYNEHRDLLQEHNERLEFLGDSVFGLVISNYLYRQLPLHAEGQLSHLRSRLVEASSCILYMQKLDVGGYVLLGRGERMNDGRGRATIMADLFEALVGAIYLDGGIEAAERFVLEHFEPEVRAVLSEPLRNSKAELQDYFQKRYQKHPVYRVVGERGPDHSKKFQVVVSIDERELGQGIGSSKKEAEQVAAEDALRKLEALDG